MSLTFHF